MSIRSAVRVWVSIGGVLAMTTGDHPGRGLAGFESTPSTTLHAGRGKIDVRDRALAARLISGGARLIADYGSYQLLEADAAQTAALPQAAVRRDEYDRILLNTGALDTTQAGVQSARGVTGAEGRRLYLVQFAGPIQPAWYAALEATGVEIVQYIPHNAYLVYGTGDALAPMDANAATQWLGLYRDEYKIQPGARRADADGRARGPVTDRFEIQLVRDPEVNRDTMAALEARQLAPVLRRYEILKYVNVLVRLPDDALDAIAARPDVVAIQAAPDPVLHDERQNQIVAGNISGVGPNGANYVAQLAAWGFTQAQFTTSGFAVDVSDSGIDNATTSPNHFGLYVNGIRPGTSRVAYNRLEGTPNSGSTLQGCDGHGTLNAHIVAGYNGLNGAPHTDASGYHYGLGVAPFVKVGSTVLFDNGYTSPSFPSIQAKAYQDGARISTNSWGASVSGTYNTDSQAYDALVRDAQPSGAPIVTAGNQEMVIVFSAGNDGPGTGTAGSPGTGKNVITVGASENVHAFGAADGCGIADDGADSAFDIASFSSRGPTKDGRMKPDLVAPGTHVTGGVFQIDSPPVNGQAAACFTADGVCGGPSSHYFPVTQQWTSASSGTSHAAPAVAGGAALVRQYFINKGRTPPSPAMTKAVLMNSAQYMNGVGAGDTLWSRNQGMGLMNLGTAFADVNRLLYDQRGVDTFTATGQTKTYTVTVDDATRAFRVTLAWTDPPGPTSGAAYVNNLDLEVTVGGQTYLGNVFTGALSTAGGSADGKNNVESVFLPAGVTGTASIRIRATNIAGDGVPNSGTALDQDFALVVYNASASAPAPSVSITGTTLTAESCAPSNSSIDPNETVSIGVTLRNEGEVATTNLVATLLATGGVTSPGAAQTFGVLEPAGSAVTRTFTFTAGGVACSSDISATFQLQDGAVTLPNVVRTFTTGALATTLSEGFDGVTPPSFPAGWTASLAAGAAADAWVTTTASSDTGPNNAFTDDPSVISDKSLSTPDIPITTAMAQLTFRQSYAFESGYDGGVLEIKIGAGAFTDILTAGGSFVTGGYTGAISGSYSNPIGGRQGWTGSSGGYVTTTVSLPAAASGQTIQLRWRAGSDTSVGSTGWHVDTITVLGGRTCCSSGCTYSLSPVTQTLRGSAGTGSVAVTTAGGCAWTASTVAAWLAIDAPGTGTGSGTVPFHLLANGTGALRSASVTVNGASATVRQAVPFTDDEPVAQSTTIKTAHITELRTRINAVRVARGLGAFSWTDPALGAGTTPVRVVHVTELREALRQAYVAAGVTPPSYTDPTLTAGTTTIRLVHLQELRAAVIALE